MKANINTIRLGSSTIGAVGIASLVGFFCPTNNNSNTESHIESNEIDQESDSELTNHCMRLSESSLAEDWDQDYDNHWDSYLNEV